jgi:putative alpha-1,2-mannosidase
VIDAVDPFIGTEITDLPPAEGLAASWWMPKPQIGNTHPGATYPFGMVSACAYSGAYPTGYGRHELATEGVPRLLHDRLRASGFTHFQQSGTGAIRKYYNYFRVTPMMQPLEALDTLWAIRDEAAEPGYYRCTLDTGVRAELTVGAKSAVHRYSFPAHHDSRLVIDFSLGGLAIAHGRTVPLRADLELVEPGVARGELVVEGAPLAVHIECDAPDWRQMLWYDHLLMPGGTRLEFDYIRPTTLRPFGMLFAGPTEPGQSIELRIGFSLRGTEQAHRNLRADCGEARPSFSARRAATGEAWQRQLSTMRVESASADRDTVFATALYHSMIKPCFAPDESPWWPGPGPFAFDICTMWDIYRTQLPLLTAIAPDRSVDLANALLQICEQEGNLPIGYRMAKGADRFARQGSGLAHTFVADLCALGRAGIDWEWAMCLLEPDLRRNYGEDFLEQGIAHPVSHTLDLAAGYFASAAIARQLGDRALAGQFESLAANWKNAVDPATGLLVDSTFYEGGKWNYSFRIVHDMAGRVALAGGERRYGAMLDEFFGFGQPPVKQPGEAPTSEELAAGYALNRFEGMNNEPDMEAPWAYHYIGRPDRTAEVVHAAVHNQFGTGRGGLPGNDDSGGLSSWFVWASIGLFPVAGQNVFMVNAPAFVHSRIALADATLSIETKGFVEPEPDRPPQYVRSATLDGRPLDRSWLSGNELHRGGQLVLELGDTPAGWATTTRPPSSATTESHPLTERHAL